MSGSDAILKEYSKIYFIVYTPLVVRILCCNLVGNSPPKLAIVELVNKNVLTMNFATVELFHWKPITI